jgi:hypothetical protein
VQKADVLTRAVAHSTYNKENWDSAQVDRHSPIEAEALAQQARAAAALQVASAAQPRSALRTVAPAPPVVVYQDEDEDEDENDDDGNMELTVAVGGIRTKMAQQGPVPALAPAAPAPPSNVMAAAKRRPSALKRPSVAGRPPAIKQARTEPVADDTTSMDLTTVLGGIVRSLPPLTASAAAATAATGTNQGQDDDMEMTVAVGGVLAAAAAASRTPVPTPKALAAPTTTVTVPAPISEPSDAMEMTVAVGGLLATPASTQTVRSVVATTPGARSAVGNKDDDDDDDGDDGPEMEMTVAVGGLLAATPGSVAAAHRAPTTPHSGAASVSTDDVDGGAMDMTVAVGGLLSSAVPASTQSARGTAPTPADADVTGVVLGAAATPTLARTPLMDLTGVVPAPRSAAATPARLFMPPLPARTPSGRTPGPTTVRTPASTAPEPATATTLDELLEAAGVRFLDHVSQPASSSGRRSTLGRTVASEPAALRTTSLTHIYVCGAHRLTRRVVGWVATTAERVRIATVTTPELMLLQFVRSGRPADAHCGPKAHHGGT